MSTRQSGKMLVYILIHLIKDAWGAVFIQYMCIRVSKVKKLSNMSLIKVVDFFIIFDKKFV